MFSWSLSCLPHTVEDWLKKLIAIDQTRLVVTRTPGKKRQTLAYYAETKKEALVLQKLHGGVVAKIDDSWMQTPSPHPPIRIRNRLVIVENASSPPDPREIVIPAGMAFGTGDHPTTASCLRFLVDETAEKKLTSLLDVGTGSGVIAIAAKKLGAPSVDAFDYDPVAIRAAKENARTNGVRGIRWEVADILRFEPKQHHQVVAANIFSELFLAGWPHLAPAVDRGGAFILSGILRFQEAECRAAFEKKKFVVEQTVRLGKWVTFLARRR